MQTKQFLIAFILAVAASSARPTAPPPTTNAITPAYAERDALVRGSFLADRAAPYAIVTAQDLGMTGRNPFAVMNGGVDPNTNDCFCLRPGNLALQGKGYLGLSRKEPSPDTSTTLRMAARVNEYRQFDGFGLAAPGPGRKDISYEEATGPTGGSSRRTLTIFAASEAADDRVANSGRALVLLEDGAGAPQGESRGALGWRSPGSSGSAFGFGGVDAPISVSSASAADKVSTLEDEQRYAGTGVGIQALTLLPAPSESLLTQSPARLVSNAGAGPVSGEPAVLASEQATGSIFTLPVEQTLLQNTMRFYAAIEKGTSGRQAQDAGTGSGSGSSASEPSYASAAAGIGPPYHAAPPIEEASSVPQIELYLAPRLDGSAEKSDSAPQSWVGGEESIAQQISRSLAVVSQEMELPANPNGASPASEERAAVLTLAAGVDLDLSPASPGGTDEGLSAKEIDIATTAPVPEPGTIVTFIVGCLLLLFGTSRRRARP